jgi:uncharacterized protein (DUF2062 family)
LFKGERRPPWYDARGVAVGLAIGLGAPIGLQMVVLGLTRIALRFNAVIAFAFTWVNNPLTLAPMYYGHYLVGSAALGRPALLGKAAFLEALAPLTGLADFREAVGPMLALGGDIALRWTVGAVIVSAVCGTVGYLVAYWALTHSRDPDGDKNPGESTPSGKKEERWTSLSTH